MAGILLLGASGVAPSGKSVLNISSNGALAFKNFMKSGQGLVLLASNMNSNGYPISTPRSNDGMTLSLDPNYTGQWTLSYTGSGRVQFLGSGAQIFDGGAAVIGNGGGNIGIIATNFTIDGTLAKPVVFDFSSTISNAADNGSGLIRLTMGQAPSGGGNVTVNCVVAGVVGVPANGSWVATVINSTTVDLNAPFSGSYVSGGRFNPALNAATFFFLNSGTWSNFDNLILCRSSAPYAGDLAAIQGGILTNQFNDTFVNSLVALNPGVLRFMDVASINGSFLSRSSYLTPTTAIAYNAGLAPPSIQAGALSGTNTYTASSYTDMPGSWTDGECFQAIFTTAPTKLSVVGAANNGSGLIRLQLADTSSLTTGQFVSVSGYNNATFAPSGNGDGNWFITVIDSTHIDLSSSVNGPGCPFLNAWSSGGTVSTATVNIGSRGAILLANNWGGGFNVSISNGQSCTLVYDSLQQCCLVSSGSGSGLSTLGLIWPLPIRVALCNKINAHMWHNFPTLYNLASVASDTAYIAANLNALIGCYFENGNELWNTGFQQNKICNYRAAVLGFGLTNQIDYAAYKHAVVMKQVTTTWGARSGLQRVLPWQAVDAGSTTTQNLLYKGTNLNGTSFPNFGTLTSGQNYDTNPNRPIDVTDQISFAPYINSTMDPGGLHADGLTFSSVDITRITNAADNYALGTAPGIAASFAWFDNDIRQGTTHTQLIASITGGNTINITGHGFSNNHSVVFSLDVGATIYSGLSTTTRYFVVNVATNTFQISATSGGTALSISGGSGNIYIGKLVRQSMLGYVADIYPGWVTAATTFSKGIACYEGGYGVSTLTTAQCTSPLGISTSYGGTGQLYGVTGGTFYTALQAYKNDATFYASMLKYLQDLPALYASTLPNWYTFTHNGTLLTSDPWTVIPTVIGSTPFKSYDAMQYFNTH